MRESLAEIGEKNRRRLATIIDRGYQVLEDAQTNRFDANEYGEFRGCASAHVSR